MIDHERFTIFVDGLLGSYAPHCKALHVAVKWAAKKKETTATWYGSGIVPLVAYKPIANLALDAITSESADDYIEHRAAEGRAVGTINRELRVLRRCLRLAVEWRLLEDAPDVSMAGPEI